MNIKEPSALYAVVRTVDGKDSLWITATPPGQSEDFSVRRVTEMLSATLETIQRLLNEPPNTSADPLRYRC